MEVIYGQGSWGTLSAICFLFSSLFSDLLLIRFWLVCAYWLLALYGALGFPHETQWFSSTGIFVAGVVGFSVVGGALHTAAFLRLVWDERALKIHGEDEEQLWRLMYRRSGMNRLEFQECVKLGSWVRVKPGDVVFDEDNNEQEECLTLSILVSGLVRFAPLGTPDNARYAHMWQRLYSGAMFSLLVCNLFGIFLGFETDDMGIVIADTDVLLFQWPFDAVEKMALNMGPSINGFWRNLLTFQLANELNRARFLAKGEMIAYSADGEMESPAFFKGARSQDFTRPLQQWEIEHFGFKEFCRWIYNSFDINSPIGIRHNSLPKTGQLARGRLHVRTTLTHIRSRSHNYLDLEKQGSLTLHAPFARADRLVPAIPVSNPPPLMPRRPSFLSTATPNVTPTTGGHPALRRPMGGGNPQYDLLSGGSPPRAGQLSGAREGGDVVGSALSAWLSDGGGTLPDDFLDYDHGSPDRSVMSGRSVYDPVQPVDVLLDVHLMPEGGRREQHIVGNLRGTFERVD